MPSLVAGFEYDIFISYRQKDNEYDGWVAEFVANLKKELRATFKEEASVYFDANPVDGLLEAHQVDESLQGKLKCAVFIPIVSQTYCDPKSFAWTNEFLKFKKLASEDAFGLKIKLGSGNVSSRILPVRIHELDSRDRVLLETELGPLRTIDFIFNAPGVNRPLTPTDSQEKNLTKTYYRDQINKVANSVKELISAMRGEWTALPATSSASITGPRKKMWIPVMVVLAVLITVAVLYLMGDSLFSQQGGSSGKKSVAVMAFEDLSPNRDQEWFSDGISEEITNSLANIPELRVMARTSSFYFKGKDVPISEIGERLGVEHIIEGSVRRIDDELRITVQLVNASDGFHVWSQTYNRKVDDLFTVQEEIADQISRKLIEQLDFTRKVRPEQPASVEAYQYYLRGKQSFYNSLADAEGYFLKAIKLDPTYASAYGALAVTYNSLGNYTSDRSKYWRMRDSISVIAIRLSPNSVEAVRSRSQVHYYSVPPNFDSGFYFVRRAYLLDPNFPQYHSISNFFFYAGLYNNGLRFERMALKADPLNIVFRRGLTDLHIYFGRYDSAEFESRKMIEIGPNDPTGYSRLAMTFIYQGKMDSAKSNLERSERFLGTRNNRLRAMLLAAEGGQDSALRLDNGPLVLSLLGLKREAMNRIDSLTSGKRYAFGEVTLTTLWTLEGLDRSPIWDFIRSEPQFKEIRQRVKRDHDERLRKFGRLN